MRGLRRYISKAPMLVTAFLFLTMIGALVQSMEFVTPDSTALMKGITFAKDGREFFQLQPGEEQDVRIEYCGIGISGQLKLTSVQQDVATYTLRDLEVESGDLGEGAYFVMRVPRGYSEQAHCGQWAFDFAVPKMGFNCSESFLLRDDGTALYSSSGKTETIIGTHLSGSWSEAEHELSYRLNDKTIVLREYSGEVA